jgi:hypothetical protein
MMMPPSSGKNLVSSEYMSNIKPREGRCKNTYHFEYFVADGRIILKHILKTLGTKVKTVYN